MTRTRHLVRVQEKGQVTLPIEVRRALKLKKGDLVAIELTEDGALLTPQETVATRALDAIGEILRERGISLEELIESGRDVRAGLLNEPHGSESPAHH